MLFALVLSLGGSAAVNADPVAFEMVASFDDVRPLLVESGFSPGTFEHSAAEVTLNGSTAELAVEARGLGPRKSAALAVWNAGFSVSGVVCSVFAVSGPVGAGSAAIGVAAATPFIAVGMEPIEDVGSFADPLPRPADLWMAEGGPGHIDRACSPLEGDDLFLSVGVVGTALAGSSPGIPGWARLRYRQAILRAEVWLCSLDDEARCAGSFTA